MSAPCPASTTEGRGVEFCGLERGHEGDHCNAAQPTYWWPQAGGEPGVQAGAQEPATGGVRVANTPAAIDAAQAYAARTGTCVQAALDASGTYAYCACSGCQEAHAAQAAGEAWAEGAWLRAAENVEQPCYCGRGQGGICC